MGLEFLAVLQRPQAEQPPQRGRLQRLARQQVRTQQQARQQARRQVRRRKNRRQGEERTRVRLPPRAQRWPESVKQLLLPLTAEAVLHHQKNERRVRNKNRSRQRQVVAAKLKRDLKLSKLQLKDRPRARKQRDQLGSGHEVAKPRLHRNGHKNNQFGLTVSVSTTANQPGV